MRRSLTIYNLHLESRGGNTYRAAQLNEVLADAETFAPEMPVLMAGDFNFDTTLPGPSQAIHRAGFSPALSLKGGPTTPRILKVLPGWSIDHAYIRGPIHTCGGHVVKSARGSDHWPLAFSVELI